MKVLATTDVLGGVFTYAVTLARTLAAHGVDTVLVTMGGPIRPSQRASLATVPGLVFHETGFRLEWMDAPWDDVARAGRFLGELADAVRPDLVHLNGYAHGALDLGVPKVVVAHSCVLSWWRAVHREDAPPAWDRYREAVRFGLAGADAVVAPTAAFLEEVASLYGPLPNAHAVWNGIDVPLAHGFHAREPLVLAAGRVWDEAKNLAVLDAVAARIAWPIHVAGDARHPDGRTLAARHARLLGPLSRGALLGRMRRAAILCHPARYEPFGLVPLEAAAAGCALVLGDIPTLREIWRDAALFVPPDDADAVADAVTRLAEDDLLRVRMARTAHARARELSAERQAARMVSLYRELAGQAARQRRDACAEVP